MGADATLVNAAYAAAMANVPSDWSQIFNKQYEGLLLAHEAKWEAWGNTMETFGEVGTGLHAQAKTDQKLREIQDNLNLNLDEIYKKLGIEPQTIGELTTNNAKVGVDENQKHYKDGGASNPAALSAAQERFEFLKDEIKKISGKKFLTKKDKKKRTDLLKNFELMKTEAIEDKATAIKYH